MQPTKICSTCGTHIPPHIVVDTCPICADDRQYIPEEGQRWTLPEDLATAHRVRIRALQQNVHELEIAPTFAIGQRAFLILAPGGNILWDCIPLLDEAAVEFINRQGGVKAIAFSHPHYYSNMNEWAATFNCPIYIHALDAPWIVDGGKHVALWSGTEKILWDGITVQQIGGHFPGSCILHVPWLSAEGTIFCGDTLAVAPSKKHIAVQYSYPNRIPLPVAEVVRIKERLEGIPFDALYGFWSYQNLKHDVKGLMKASMERYLL